MKHLLSTRDLSTDDIVSIMAMADHMAEINSRAVPKVPALRGRTIASVFFEDSPRTRLSFDTAATRLSAEVMTFTARSSSVNKGESLRDTIETLSAMGVDAFVVRHKSSGAPQQITQWTDASVVNAAACNSSRVVPIWSGIILPNDTRASAVCIKLGDHTPTSGYV